MLRVRALYTVLFVLKKTEQLFLNLFSVTKIEIWANKNKNKKKDNK